MKYVAVNENTLERYSCDDLRVLWRLIMRHRKEAHELKYRADSWRLGRLDENDRLIGKGFAEIPGGYSNCIHIYKRAGNSYIGRYFILEK